MGWRVGTMWSQQLYSSRIDVVSCNEFRVFYVKIHH